MGKKTQPMGKAHPTKEWKDMLGVQVTEDSLWELTKDYNSYLNHNNGLTISTDPLNLSGLNTKRAPDGYERRNLQDVSYAWCSVHSAT